MITTIYKNNCINTIVHFKQAYELSSAPNSEVLVIIANYECRKFIFASPRLRPYIMSKECASLIEGCLGKGTFSAGQESRIDK